MNKAIFLDRDGTINYDYGYVFDPDKIKILAGCAEAIANLRKLNFKIIIVSNQSCIGRGMATEHQVNKTNQRFLDLLLEENNAAKIDLIKICPDHPERPTARRKPGPGMLLESKDELGIDLSLSWIVGDKISDVESGVAAGIPKMNCILVPPNQTQEIENKQNYLLFQNLLEVSTYIKKNCA